MAAMMRMTLVPAYHNGDLIDHGGLAAPYLHENRRQRARDNVVEAYDATMGQLADPEQAESVALSPLVCEGPASALSWRTFGGAEQTYRLLVGEDIDAGTLDLFAHPPLVRVGTAAAEE